MENLRPFSEEEETALNKGVRLPTLVHYTPRYAMYNKPIKPPEVKILKKQPVLLLPPSVFTQVPEPIHFRTKNLDLKKVNFFCFPFFFPEIRQCRKKTTTRLKR